MRFTWDNVMRQQVNYTHKTVSVIGLEFLSSLESGFPRALHLQSTVKLVLQYLSHGVLHHHFDNEGQILNFKV